MIRQKLATIARGIGVVIGVLHFISIIADYIESLQNPFSYFNAFNSCVYLAIFGVLYLIPYSRIKNKKLFVGLSILFLLGVLFEALMMAGATALFFSEAMDHLPYLFEINPNPQFIDPVGDIIGTVTIFFGVLVLLFVAWGIVYSIKKRLKK